jgi:hypothetical protein
MYTMESFLEMIWMIESTLAMFGFVAGNVQIAVSARRVPWRARAVSGRLEAAAQTLLESAFHHA